MEAQCSSTSPGAGGGHCAHWWRVCLWAQWSDGPQAPMWNRLGPWESMSLPPAVSQPRDAWWHSLLPPPASLPGHTVSALGLCGEGMEVAGPRVYLSLASCQLSSALWPPPPEDKRPSVCQIQAPTAACFRGWGQVWCLQGLCANVNQVSYFPSSLWALLAVELRGKVSLADMEVGVWECGWEWECGVGWQHGSAGVGWQHGRALLLPLLLWPVRVALGAGKLTWSPQP